VHESDVHVLNTADTINQHYHHSSASPAEPLSLEELQGEHAASMLAVRVARRWVGACVGAWGFTTMAIWALMPLRAPPESGAIGAATIFATFMMIPYAVWVFIPESLKTRSKNARHLIKRETEAMAEFQRLIQLELARRRLGLRR